MSDLEALYRERQDRILVPLATRLEDFLRECLADCERIDRISARAKAVNRFLAKASKQQDGKSKYDDPLSQIQDQIGARIVTFFLSDVETISHVIKEYFRPIEHKSIIPDSESEFGYIGKHFILFLPTDIFDDDIPEEASPKFFELQIKTLFQHAWSEANHDLGYKPTGQLSPEQKRYIAFTAAQAWGADQVFNTLHSELS